MNLDESQEEKVTKIIDHLKDLLDKTDQHNIDSSGSLSEKLKNLRTELSNLMEDFTQNDQGISSEIFNKKLNQFESLLKESEMEIERSIIEKVGFSEYIIINPPMDIDKKPCFFNEIKNQEINNLLDSINKLSNLKVAGPFRKSLENIQTQLEDLLKNEDQETYYACIDVFKKELNSFKKQINNCNEALTNIATGIPTWDFSENLENSVMSRLVNSEIEASFEDIEPQRLQTHHRIDEITKKFSSDEKHFIWYKTLDQLKNAVNGARTVRNLSTFQSTFEYKVEQYNQRIKKVLGSATNFISSNPTFPEAIACACNKEEVDKIICDALSNPKENSIIINNYCDLSLLGSSRNNNRDEKMIQEAFEQHEKNKSNTMIETSETIDDDDDDELAKAIALSMER